MRSLARVASKPGATGVPLPPVFTELEKAGIRPRRGQVTMICAAPNGGKSFLALYWVLRLVQGEGLSALYFSADTDDMTTKVRALAILTGDDVDLIERRILKGKGQEYDDLLWELKGLRFDFETDPDFPHMGEEILAFNEAWGQYPDVIVVDNLMNVVSGREDEWPGMKDVTKGLHRMARLTDAAVFVLHHMREDGDPTYPAPRRGIAGRLSQLPEMILSLGFDPVYGLLRIACVKNRGGPADPSGETYVTFYTDVAHGAIYENKWARNEGKAA